MQYDVLRAPPCVPIQQLQDPGCVTAALRLYLLTWKLSIYFPLESMRRTSCGSGVLLVGSCVAEGGCVSGRGVSEGGVGLYAGGLYGSGDCCQRGHRYEPAGQLGVCCGLEGSGVCVSICALVSTGCACVSL